MNWDLEKILEMKEDEFEKEINKIEPIDLSARIDKVQGILKKNDLGLSTLVGREITPKRQKLSTLLAILTSVRDRKLREHDDTEKKAREKWRDDALRENLPDIRIAYGSQVEHLMTNAYTMQVVDWQKLFALEFEIMAVSGHKLKLDLRKIVSPSTMQMLLGKTLCPIYLLVERSGGYDRHGKRLGYYVSAEYNEAHGYEIRLSTTLAIMRV